MRAASLLLLMIAHASLASFAVGLVVFYFFPHDFYFATPAYAIAFLTFLATNYLVPAGTKLLPFKDNYLQTLVLRPVLSWKVTGAIVAVALAWTYIMFD